MLQKIKSRIKTEGIPWIRRHKAFVTIVVVLAFFQVPILGIMILYGLVASFSIDMLKAMIEAQATILGFYGLIVVYALTSFDGRIDRLENQKFELNKEIRFMTEEDREIWRSREKYVEISKTLINVQKIRKRTVDSTLFNGILLIGSLLTSILGLGFSGITDYPFGELVFYLTSISVLLFFFSIALILLMIHDLAHSPKNT